MKENSIEEDVAKVNTYIELVLEKDYCNCNELNTILGNHCDGSKNVAYAMQHILSDYKRVLKENEKYKRLSEMNLKNAEEFKNNMCEHRCLLKSENEELQRENEELKKFITEGITVAPHSTYKNYRLDFLRENFVSKKKIKDKIRKNEEIIDISNDGDLIHELLQKNKVYEELLESEK